jgi:DNA-binding CsgD family transcriptional regulator
MEVWLWAAEAATSAASAYERLGLRARSAAALARREELVRRCGSVTTPALDATTSLTPLTGREREVVELAARGLTNREIADRLIVSTRTVEGHLLRAFPKLGITSRQELSQVVARDLR